MLQGMLRGMLRARRGCDNRGVCNGVCCAVCCAPAWDTPLPCCTRGVPRAKLEKSPCTPPLRDRHTEGYVTTYVARVCCAPHALAPQRGVCNKVCCGYVTLTAQIWRVNTMCSIAPLFVDTPIYGTYSTYKILKITIYSLCLDSEAAVTARRSTAGRRTAQHGTAQCRKAHVSQAVAKDLNC